MRLSRQKRTLKDFTDWITVTNGCCEPQIYEDTPKAVGVMRSDTGSSTSGGRHYPPEAKFVLCVEDNGGGYSGVCARMFVLYGQAGGWVDPLVAE